ncbi:Fe(3+)-hydroxamate ABC transporter permease FhuB [Phyllobacterium sp. BT25]|uniref:Fe(3+)-hydroxamate ABC transporter permease FhuB n=1 Tax=Phyllobacterium pellucidum TaxID=2740464 RepID=A0A849VY94_9HYPH|nr:Fe(3+)-hydroxamate ABC transporter permease FhuB [Phyllobacterium pellucidum]NTS33804.1 Fe(3+)-hydroxamate ABC transporter permease FhuB [Phyllobacterium pellucidum]
MKRKDAQPWLWIGALWAAALAITAFNLLPSLEGLSLGSVFSTPSPDDSRAVLAHYSLLPRLAMAAICGFALGLSGMLFQHVLRNPLASPSTLGIEAGAQLSLGIAMLWFPAILGWSRDISTAFGGFAAVGIVFAVGWKYRFNSVVVILTGMVTGLYCTAVVTLLTLMNDHYLAGLFIWGGGSLNQNDWRQVATLTPKIIGCSVLALLLVKQLSVLTLGDAAQALGVKIQSIRAGALFVAVALTAFTVSAVGIIGFLGLAAPAIARAIGARRIATRLIAASLAGAALLIIVDQLVQFYGAVSGVSLPTGAVTAVIGAPFLLFLMLRRNVPNAIAVQGKALIVATPRPRLLLSLLLLLLAAAALLAIVVGRDINAGWASQAGETLRSLLPWRVPRLVAAISAGVLLALSGSLLQRLTGNALASPEVLGVSAGTALGLLCMLFLVAQPTYAHRLIGGFSGAGVVLVILFAVNRRSHAGNQFLIFGVSLGALLTALVSVILASGDPRALFLLSWMAGSTYGVTPLLAWTSAAFAIAGLFAVILLARPLQHFALGDISAHAHGVDIKRFRALILGLSALLTAIATLVVGPLSFVGLMAPHLAQRVGLPRGTTHILGSALFGALLMAAADFIGRTIYFPWQLPTGLVATLLGGPIFAVLIIRGSRQSVQH